jgi:hypothetical protein
MERRSPIEEVEILQEINASGGVYLPQYTKMFLVIYQRVGPVSASVLEQIFIEDGIEDPPERVKTGITRINEVVAKRGYIIEEPDVYQLVGPGGEPAPATADIFIRAIEHFLGDDEHLNDEYLDHVLVILALSERDGPTDTQTLRNIFKPQTGRNQESALKDTINTLNYKFFNEWGYELKKPKDNYCWTRIKRPISNG